MFNFLKEGIEQGDLKRLVHPELHIDEYKSKLGKDEDICVVSFKVTGNGPATDLVNFIEKGYDWVVDADVSSGEMDDGDYIVFVEADRNADIAKNVMKMMTEILNITAQELGDWRVRYYKHTDDHELTEESLAELIPNSPDAYRAKYGEEETEQNLDDLRAAAGVKVTTKAPKNEMTEWLRNVAGIIR